MIEDKELFAAAMDDFGGASGTVVIEVVKNLKKGTRLKITGSLPYRPFEVMSGEGEVITKMEASIIAGKVEHAPLVKKHREEATA